MRSVESAILSLVAPITQKAVAEAIGVDATNLSRYLGGTDRHRLTFHESCRLLERLGVTGEMILAMAGDSSVACVPRDEWDATRLLARKGLEVT